MRAVVSRARRDERGYSLIELLIVCGLLAVVLSAVLAVLDAVGALAPKEQERTHTVTEAATGVYTMTRELRGTYQIITANDYVFEANVYKRGQGVHVRYDCSGASSIKATWGQCLRSVISSGGVTTEQSVVLPAFTNVAASGRDVFSYGQNSTGQTTRATVHVEVPAAGSRKNGYSHNVVYDNSVRMPNVSSYTETPDD